MAGDDLEDSGGLSLTTLVLLILAVVIALAVGIPQLIPAKKTPNRVRAIGALKTIGIAQTLFREGDKEQDGNLDYGTLAELGVAGNTGLIDWVLASGTKSGYLFEVTYGSSTSEFLWFATARPTLPGVTGEAYFCSNHQGAIFYTVSSAFRLNSDDCTIPAGASQVGR